MSKFNFNPDATQRGLKFVRQFHTKRVLRFLKGRQFRDIEDQTDLQRSKDMIIELNGMIKDAQ